MSLDIFLIDENEETVVEMNWLRNPYGLCNWAEDSIAEAFGYEPEIEHSLWYAINNWSYDDSPNVDRKLFLDVVIIYQDVIESLEQGYFFFDVSSYRQFIEGKTKFMPQEERIPIFIRNAIFKGTGIAIKGERLSLNNKLMIPIENFNHAEFHIGDDPCLKRYQDWFEELVDFAKMLQVEWYTYYCSN